MSTTRDVLRGLRIQSAEDGGVLHLRGELDLSTVGVLRSALEERLPIKGDLILDLSELDFLDSTGLQEILKLADRCSGVVVVRQPSGMVRKLLRVTGLDHTQRIIVEPDGNKTAR